MSDQNLLSDEAIENLYDQMFDLYLEDALDERGFDESDLRKAQILFLSPFKDHQFDGMRGGDSDVVVRINEEAEVVLSVELDTDREIQAGDPIRWEDIDDLGEVAEVPDFGNDVGHITFVRFPNGVLYVYFDFLYNRTYIEPLIRAADEFIGVAAHARENESWRAFVENAMHATELLMKAVVIRHGDPAYQHHIIEKHYRKYVEAGIGNGDLLEVYGELSDYRFAATYVDPGDHPDGIDEKDFNLSNDEGDRILSVITDHRNTIQLDSAE